VETVGAPIDGGRAHAAADRAPGDEEGVDPTGDETSGEVGAEEAGRVLSSPGGLAGQLAQPLVDHHPLTPLYEPAVRPDLADPDAGLLELGVIGEVEKITGISAARAAPSNEIVACTWPSSSLASGDRTTVNPRIRSTTNRAGRSPKPTRRPKPFS